MGTTQTPNLSLIKPDGTEPASNWPAQVGANYDTLDALFPNAGSYTPIFGSSSEATQVDEGTGGDAARTGRFIKIGKLIIVLFRFTLGASGASVPSSGIVEVSLPQQPDTTFMDITATTSRTTFFNGRAQFNADGITDDNNAGTCRLVPAASSLISPDNAVRIIRDNFKATSMTWGGSQSFAGNENEYLSGFVAYKTP